ncbi:unnamed protein product [Notodromas monacha]|uniref:Origin recognition complex subunit 1 n=1 Tax=Notodromas monacha TaxID=399045 RepID=A0A7R9BNF4_9CRUS|nr:unnamed protein product [Notodromas monacha]CAG0918734.1 unnamed protein product [Notodromas monacha]
MPVPYEVMIVLRTMSKPGLIDAVKRTSKAILSQGFYLRKVENLGTRRLPDRMKKLDIKHTEASYNLLHVDGYDGLVDGLKDYLRRDPDILKFLVTTAENPSEQRNCSLADEALPPPYREDVQAMIELGEELNLVTCLPSADIVLTMNFEAVTYDIDGDPIELRCETRDERFVTHFRFFVWKGETIEVGDTVLVAGDDDEDYVGRIDDVFDSESPLALERYRAKMSWFTKWLKMPKPDKKIILRNLPVDIPGFIDEELIFEERPFDNDVALSSVLQKCVVEELRPEDNAKSAFKNVSESATYFVARFSYDGKALKSLRDVNAAWSYRRSKKHVIPQWISDMIFFKASLTPFSLEKFKRNVELSNNLFMCQREKFQTCGKGVISKTGKSCLLAGTKFHESDNVMLSNGDRDVDEDDIGNVYLARISGFVRETNCIVIRYFSRLHDFDECKGLDRIHPSFLPLHEAAFECDDEESEVPVGSLLGKFELVKIQEKQDPRVVMSEVDLGEYPVFVTRFAYAKKDGELVAYPQKSESIATPKSMNVVRSEQRSMTKSERGFARKQLQKTNSENEKIPNSVLIDNPPQNCSKDPKRKDTRSAEVETPQSEKRSTRKRLTSKELVTLLEDSLEDEDDETEWTISEAPHKTDINGLSWKLKLKKNFRADDKENLFPEDGLSTERNERTKTSPTRPKRSSCRTPLTTPMKETRREVDDDDDFMTTPEGASSSKLNSSSKQASSLRKSALKVKDLFGNIKLPDREGKDKLPGTPLMKARASLHASKVPDSLPCRENEFMQIYVFAETHIKNGTGGCMYISGVPGTGKTATVQEVVRALQDARDVGDIPQFKYIELNGMRITKPERTYTELWSGISDGERLAPVNACEKIRDFLDSRCDFGKGKKVRSQKKKPSPSYLVLVDELDHLWTRKQNLLYNLFDWPNKPGSRLVILAVANTMDLPERMMINRVQSRLGLDRLVFHAYTFPELQKIIESRLEENDCFDPDAIQLVARKVASVSGDARRALNICQKATEEAERMNSEKPVSLSTPKKGRKSEPISAAQVTMNIINKIIRETFSEPGVLAVRSCSLAEQIFLRALCAEFEQTGKQDAKLMDVYAPYKALCHVEAVECTGPRQLMLLCENLASSGIVINEGSGKKGIYQKVMLSVTSDCVHFALHDCPDDEA